MKGFAKLMTAAALAGSFAAPAAAQYPYPYPYSQQPYPAPYPPTNYPYPGQGYGYGNQGILGNIIDGLIGNRYNVSDRQAIRQCAFAAVQRAENQYRPYSGNMPYAYQGYSGSVRVTAITDVQRRSRGVRVRGLLDSANYGYGNGPYGADLKFRCDVDYRGYVYNLDIDRNENYRHY